MDGIKWSELPFGYMRTNYHTRCYYRNGKWGEIEVSSSEYIEIHIAATALHYGQEAFEGLKAFMGKDGRIRIFRWKDNWKRMNDSADVAMMQKIPEEIFREACFKAILLNKEFVPPYGTGASLYIRPLLIGSGAQVGVKPASEYLFLLFVTPVGPYFKEGFKPVDFLLTTEYDRAAPLGTGHVKLGGNYAAGLRAMQSAHGQGFANVLFLDAKHKKFIDEAGPANFFAIKGNTYITPESSTILPSITNKSLCVIAQEIGLNVEKRPIPVEELSEFDEAGACGTAAVISPINKIVDTANDKIYKFSKDGNPGPWSVKLYETLQSIQKGDLPDTHGWVDFVE